MVPVVISAVRPWESADSTGFIVGMTGAWVKSDFTTYDDQTQIDLCLTCPLADDCGDCLTRGQSGQKRKRGFFARKSRRRKPE